MIGSRLLFSFKGANDEFSLSRVSLSYSLARSTDEVFFLSAVKARSSEAGLETTFDYIR